LFPRWIARVKKHRLAILLILALAVCAIKVIEDVLGGESGIVDEAILRFVHKHVASDLNGLFEAITFTGSAAFLFPLTTVAAITLLLAKRHFDALLLTASVISGAIAVYAIKMTVGRIRPALWEAEWNWGSSFPSGHTLVVAAFATAAVLCASRIWPAGRKAVLLVAISWTCLVALSRLVLGAHWPTDVLVAACVGAILPLVMSVALEVRRT
jgi:undecaprenyl-diphosphatase